MNNEERKKLTYGFGHAVAAHIPHAHAADSGDLAEETFVELGLSPATKDVVEELAQHVAGDYEYTGRATDLARRFQTGEA